MTAPDMLRLSVARLIAAPWHDADPASLEHHLSRRLSDAQRAAALAIASNLPTGCDAVRRWVDNPTRPHRAESLLPRSTAGAVFLLPRAMREQTFWAVGLLLHAGVWRKTVQRAEVQALDDLIGNASHAVRQWLDDETDHGLALTVESGGSGRNSSAMGVEDLGATPSEAHARLMSAGANALARACVATEGRAYVRALRWRIPVTGRAEWRRRLRVEAVPLNQWLDSRLILNQGAEWQWVARTGASKGTA